MDFGTLKNKFTETYVESHLSDDVNGKQLYKQFLKTLNESETLKTCFIVYKNLENKTASTEFEASEYLKENLNLLDKFRGDKSIVSETRKLINLLENNGIDIPNQFTNFNQSLHTLITSSPSLENVDKIHEAKVSLVKHLLTDKTPINEDTTLVRKGVDVNKFLTVATNLYNEKYENLTEEEKHIIKVIREGNDGDKENLLHSMVKETITLVNESLTNVGENVTLKSKLLETKDVVYSMMDYNKDTFGDNVKKLYDIKSVF